MIQTRKLFLVLCLSALTLPAAFAVSKVVVEGQAAKAVKSADSGTNQAVFDKPVPENVADLLAIEKQVRKLVEKLTQCTVAVRVGGSQGSGVLVSKDGYVLTAAHVAGAPGRTAIVTLPDGREVQGKTLGRDRSHDAALLKITEKADWPFAEMGDLNQLKVGDWCVAGGHPGGFRKNRPAVVRLGRIVFIKEKIIQSGCTLMGGDSGGPLFDMKGRVIGIHSRIGVSAGWNFHIPISVYSKSWDRLVAAESWGGWPLLSGGLLGVGGDDHPQGCQITRVIPESPAQKSGLRVDDIIVKLDAKLIKSFKDLVATVRNRNPGEKVTLEILRGEKTMKITAVLASRQ